MLRVYLDTVITSGRVKRDLQPPDEMTAVDRLDLLHAQQRIKVVTSKWSRIEQERTRDLATRRAFAERVDDVSVVQGDHRLLGFQTLDYGQGGFISNPIITDVVNQVLFDKLRGVLEHDDAMHVMYAVENDCQAFVTLDHRDLLPNRATVEAICGQMRIFTPSELVAELQRALGL